MCRRRMGIAGREVRWADFRCAVVLRGRGRCEKRVAYRALPSFELEECCIAWLKWLRYPHPKGKVLVEVLRQRSLFLLTLTHFTIHVPTRAALSLFFLTVSLLLRFRPAYHASPFFSQVQIIHLFLFLLFSLSSLNWTLFSTLAETL